MLNIVKFLKKIPIDFNQYELREKSKAKNIAFHLAEKGNKRGRALDIGCRDGFWSKKMEILGYKVISIDKVSSYDKYQKVDVDKKLPFEDSSFDLIWTSEVIEHLYSPKFSISEMRRVLKKDGEIIATTPNSYFWLFKLFKLFNIPIQKVQNPDHKHFFSTNDIKQLFPKAKIFGFFPYAILKFTISNSKLISFLSPTFIIYEKKND